MPYSLKVNWFRNPRPVNCAMIRKSLSIVILVSMTLHCAARLGTLSFLYEQRHHIGYTVGLIAEIPIAMCTSNYDFDSSLKIESADSTDTAPAAFIQAQEISLFLITALDIPNFHPVVSEDKQTHFYCVSEYSSPTSPFFHPPSRG